MGKLPTRTEKRTAGALHCLLLLCVVFPALNICLHAQTNGEPVVIGKKIQIHSTIFNQDRILLIATPAGYDEGTERYPVLYVLDGESNFVQAADIAGFLAESDRIPPMLVVGIVNVNRSHDLTPRTEDELEIRFHPNTGGADIFLQSLKTELMPYINQHYRTRSYKMLVGHSLGGLFAMYALASDPQLFNAYIAIDPTLGWNHKSVMSMLQMNLKKLKDVSSDLYVTVTEPSSVTYRLCATLKDNSPKEFRWTFKAMPEETHNSIVHQSIYSGLDTIFDGWHLGNPLKLYDECGMAAIQQHFAQGGKRYGYDREASPFTISLIVAGLLEKGRLEDAGTVLLQDQKRYPPPWNQLEALARAYAQQGNSPEAIRFYKLSLQQNPKNDWVRKKLAELGVDLKQAPAPAPQ